MSFANWASSRLTAFGAGSDRCVSRAGDPMPTALETLVRKALDAVADPVSGKGLSSSGRVTGLVVRSDGKVGFVLETGVGAAMSRCARRPKKRSWA